MTRLAAPLLALLIFILNLWLNGPLFYPGELPFRGSIEGGYVGMARFVFEHPNPWGWNPLAYCGVPTQFMYVPLLPYSTAFFMHLFPHATADTVYRYIVSLMTCLGPALLFLFTLHFTRSLRWSLGAALAYSFLSPAYGLFPAVEKDRGIVQLPWRIQVLAKYGEGPHNTGLSLLPPALLAVWMAATKGTYRRIFVAALLLAIIPLANWVSALALAISCLLLILAAWGEPGFRLSRVAAAGALAYLLACFWLTPGFIGTIAFNWSADAHGYHFQTKQASLMVGWIVGVVLIRLLFRWLRGSFYFCFTTLAAFAFGWISTGFYVFGVDTIPESRRYAIEFELFLLAALFEAGRLAMRSSNSTVRLCCMGTGAMLLLAGAPQLWTCLKQGWSPWMPSPPETTIEHRLGQWLAQHPPQGRIFASGGLRFRVNSWWDIPQVGGGFETGLRNRIPVDLAYRIRTGADLWKGHETDDTLLELKALGSDYLIVHGPKSREYYRDFLHPERIAAVLPPVYRIEDDTIYALPSRPLAHLATPAELPQADVRAHSEELVRYVAAREDTARPALRAQWTASDTLAVTGAVRPGDVVALQVNADPGWTVMQDGRPIAMSQDRLGFITLHASPASQSRIELRYRGTLEQRLMAALSGLSWLAALLLLVRSYRVARPA